MSGRKAKKIKMESQKINIENISNQLIKMIVGCSLAFSIVENEFFKNFVASLCKEYVEKVPSRSRRVVFSLLLDKLYDERCMRLQNVRFPKTYVFLYRFLEKQIWKTS